MKFLKCTRYNTDKDELVFVHVAAIDEVIIRLDTSEDDGMARVDVVTARGERLYVVAQEWNKLNELFDYQFDLEY